MEGLANVSLADIEVLAVTASIRELLTQLEETPIDEVEKVVSVTGCMKHLCQYTLNKLQIQNLG